MELDVESFQKLIILLNRIPNNLELIFYQVGVPRLGIEEILSVIIFFMGNGFQYIESFQQWILNIPGNQHFFHHPIVIN